MRNQSSPQLDTTFTQPVKSLIKGAPVFIAADATAGDAAREMQRARIGSVLVATEPPGIITDRDLRSRVLAANLGHETPVTKVMTKAIKTIDSDLLAFNALQLMVDENIHHLPVVEEGKIVGVISSTDLLFHQTNNPVYCAASSITSMSRRRLAATHRRSRLSLTRFFRAGSVPCKSPRSSRLSTMR